MTQKTTNTGYKPPPNLELDESIDDVRVDLENYVFPRRGTITYRETGLTAEVEGNIIQVEQKEEGVYVERYELDLQNGSADEAWKNIRNKLKKSKNPIASD